MQQRAGGGAGEEENLKKYVDAEEMLDKSEPPSLHLQVPFSHPRPPTVEDGCPFLKAGRKGPWASSSDPPREDSSEPADVAVMAGRHGPPQEQVGSSVGCHPQQLRWHAGAWLSLQREAQAWEGQERHSHRAWAWSFSCAGAGATGMERIRPSE